MLRTIFYCLNYERMKRYFKNRFSQLIELDINQYYLNGDLKRVNIHLMKNSGTEFLHTLFFSSRVMLDMYKLIELGDLTSDTHVIDSFSDHPFYLFCTPEEIEDFKKYYPRVMILREDPGILNTGYYA